MPPSFSPLAVVNAFTAQPFHGNPAGVCLLSVAAHGSWLQHLARELNHPETAVLWRRPATQQASHYDLRWFTPTAEVDLCGHATLAAAHWLWEQGECGGALHFHTRNGRLSAQRRGNWIWLDFPAEVAQRVTDPLVIEQLCALLGTQALWVGRNRLDYLVALPSAEAVRALSPELSRFASLGQRGVIVTAPGEGEYDCVSRGFFPNIGIPEDPVTGSAHCALAPYWSARLGKTRLLGRQVSARGGDVKMHLLGDRVHLGGQAVTVWEGRLLHPPH